MEEHKIILESFFEEGDPYISALVGKQVRGYKLVLYNRLSEDGTSTYEYFLRITYELEDGTIGERTFRAFWDYGNSAYFTDVIDAYLDYHGLWSMVPEMDFEQYLIYNPDTEHFMLLEVEDEGAPEEKSFHIPRFSWFFPKSFYSEWLENINWKRPYYITFDIEDVMRFYDRLLSVEDLYPLLVLRHKGGFYRIGRDALEVVEGYDIVTEEGLKSISKW